MLIFLNFGLAGMVILFLAAAVSYFRRDFTVGSLGGITMCLLAFLAFGAMEFVREGVRKPFVIEGFMYSTGVTVSGAGDVDTVANIDRTRRDGILSVTPWAWVVSALPVTTGEELLAGPEAAFAYAVVACLIVSVLLTVGALKTPSLAWLVTPAGAFFLALLAIAAARDTIRRAALAPVFDLSAVPVNAQWDSFVLCVGWSSLPAWAWLPT